MQLITFESLYKLKSSNFKKSPIDFNRVNLNNIYHNNLYDPFLGIIEEKDCLVFPDFSVKTNDGFIIEDITNEEISTRVSFTNIIFYENTNNKNFLLGGTTDNYSWLINWLPRMFLYKKYDLKCNVVVNNNFSDYQLETFSFFFPEYLDKLYKMDGITKFKNLIIPNFFNAPLHSPFAISNYRSKLNVSQSNFSKKFYIKNQIKGKRQLLNEKEIEKMAIKNNFVVYNLDSMTFSEQVNLFFYSKKFWSLGYLCGTEKYKILEGESVGSKYNARDADFYINKIQL